MLRGGCALVFLGLVTVAVLIEVVQGDYSNIDTWLGIILGSLVLTGLNMLWHRLRRPR